MKWQAPGFLVLGRRTTVKFMDHDHNSQNRIIPEYFWKVQNRERGGRGESMFCCSGTVPCLLSVLSWSAMHSVFLFFSLRLLKSSAMATSNPSICLMWTRGSKLHTVVNYDCQRYRQAMPYVLTENIIRIEGFDRMQNRGRIHKRGHSEFVLRSTMLFRCQSLQNVFTKSCLLWHDRFLCREHSRRIHEANTR